MKEVVYAAMACCLALGPLYSPVGQSAEPTGMFLVRSTEKTPDALVDAVKAYAEEKKWEYLGADKVKKGELTLVKLCIPEVGKQIWPLGPHLSAMLPCGNIGVYQREGKTEISLLDARYMYLIYPDPAIEKAGATAQSLLSEMLDAVIK